MTKTTARERIDAAEEHVAKYYELGEDDSLFLIRTSRRALDALERIGTYKASHEEGREALADINALANGDGT